MTPPWTERVFARFEARLMTGDQLGAALAAPVVVALSGGGDSMALLVLAADWAKRCGRRLLAVTVDHQLNPASPDWSVVCRDAAAGLGVDWIERRWDGDKPATGLTAAARAVRHGLIAEAARGAGARVILMAHTADDVDESDWMRAQTEIADTDLGATLGQLRDWSPSPVWPQGRGLMLFRPLLDVRRETLRDLLRTRGQVWIEDPANADPRFGRSRARAALAEAAKAEAASGSDLTTDSAKNGPCIVPDCTWWGGVRLPREAGGQGALLAAAVLSAAGGVTPPRGGPLNTLLQRLTHNDAQGLDFIATLCGARLNVSDHDIWIGREPGELKRQNVPDIALTPDVPAVWDGRFEITASEPGWIVTALSGRLKRLSDADRAIVMSLPAWARPTLPMLIRCDDPEDDPDDDPEMPPVLAPILAWDRARVRTLAPRRLNLALSGRSRSIGGAQTGSGQGETTQEADLFRTIHGETPPTALFSRQDHNNGAGSSAPKDREPV